MPTYSSILCGALSLEDKIRDTSQKCYVFLSKSLGMSLCHDKKVQVGKDQEKAQCSFSIEHSLKLSMRWESRNQICEIP